ncbi:MAG: DUF262 domain-containing protein [Planctomycetes bacterium]|nr:DUF262 domain-containing protein [Planctomycetota bacterium]
MTDRYLIQKTIFKVSDFISWQKTGQPILTPDFQRRSVWKKGAKSFLIDTISRGLPIPIIFLRDRRTDPNKMIPEKEVIDGQQRLRTVISYRVPELLKDFDAARDEFTVKRTHNAALAGKTFAQLEPEIKQAILDFEFSVHVFPSQVDDREVIQIFRRMNSTTYGLTKQELRNSEYFGEFKSSAYLLAAEQLKRWRTWKSFTEDDIARMNEVEHTSECMIAILNGALSGKSQPIIHSFYSKYDEKFDFREAVEK